MRKKMTVLPLDIADVEQILADAGIDLAEVEETVEQIARAPAFAEIEARMAEVAHTLQIAAEVRTNVENVISGKIEAIDRQFAAVIDEFEDHYVYGTATYDPEPQTPLTIAQAVCLPELGGRLLRAKGLSLKSPNVAEKTLRGAIDRGELAVIRPNSKNLYVTRNAINEWMSSCLVNSKSHTSSTESRATTRQENSLTKAPGSSSTETNSLRQGAVSQMLKKLR